MKQIVVTDKLHQRLKVEAAKRQKPLGALTEELVLAALQNGHKAPAPVRTGKGRSRAS